MLSRIVGKVQRRFDYYISRYRLREKILSCMEHLLFRLETTRFIVDTPKLDYQPLPWVGVSQADIRGDATYSRWKQIEKILSQQQGKTALDIGSCYGFFSIKMAEMGYDVIGVDLNPSHIRIARYAVPRSLRNHCNFLEMELAPGNIDFLPPVDCTLLLSVWHHWVYHFGLSDATEMLRTIWSKTKKVVFFETGEGEVIDEFNLPFNSDNSRQWLKNYLEKTCVGAAVIVVSEHEAGKYKHYTLRKTTRALFMILRNQ